MRILFTGGTSFTGMWFARALAAAGHSVVLAVRGSAADYAGLRKERVALLADQCEFRWNMIFGTERFVAEMGSAGPFDVLCHHASHVADYKSMDFDALAAVQANTLNLPQVLTALLKSGCRKLVITGTVFEADEGAGNAPLEAFSPYGLSKTLTAAIFRYHVQRHGIALGKFVIPNPFGAYQEPRFTYYLVRCWSRDEVARVSAPRYVRDNVPVSLLALAYAEFVANLPSEGFRKHNPSYYVESQGAFARRFANEIGARLGYAARLEFADQTDFSEPLTRINTDRIAVDPQRWQEASAWDQLAAYYGDRFASVAT
jgi:UDP-glucose 4-epimerase